MNDDEAKAIITMGIIVLVSAIIMVSTVVLIAEQLLGMNLWPL